MSSSAPGIEEAVNAISAVDQHAHNIRKPEAQLPFEAAFSESYDEDVWNKQTPHTIFYRRSLRQLDKLFGCGSSPNAIKCYRNALSLEDLTRDLLKAANLCHLLLDDGLSPEDILPWTWHNQFVPTHRILRLEDLAQTLLPQCCSLTEFEKRFVQALDQTGSEVVGFKSIAAYRGGLHVEPSTSEAAVRDFSKFEGRLERSALYSRVLYLALEVASDRNLPVQFHTGFGDPDLRLEQSNPLHLVNLIERFACPFVILHAGYPYTQEAGFLSSVYPNVWVDFGLALPFLSTAGMNRCLSQLFELSPLNRLLYSSDASLIPELYYLGSLNSRADLSKVLVECVENQDLTEAEAIEAAKMILCANALSLYKLAV